MIPIMYTLDGKSPSVEVLFASTALCPLVFCPLCLRYMKQKSETDLKEHESYNTHGWKTMETQ